MDQIDQLINEIRTAGQNALVATGQISQVKNDLDESLEEIGKTRQEIYRTSQTIDATNRSLVKSISLPYLLGVASAGGFVGAALALIVFVWVL